MMSDDAAAAKPSLSGEPGEPQPAGGAQRSEGADDDRSSAFTPHPKLNPEQVAATRTAASAKYRAAAAVEPAISAAVRSAVTAVEGAELIRFETRLKTEQSLFRKVQKVLAANIEWTAAEAAASVDDAVRYTVVLDEDGYWQHNEVIGAQITGLGYPAVRKPAGWNFRGYRGANNTYLGPGGLEFEVQVHTTDSLTAATVNHPKYEEERGPRTSRARRSRLRSEQQQTWNAVPVPAGTPLLAGGAVIAVPSRTGNYGPGLPEPGLTSPDR